MSNDQYKIFDQHEIYFLTLTVVRWIDIFSRREFKDLLVDSLTYCIKEKGLNVYSWVIMSNHLHLIASCRSPHTMSDFLRDFKKYTSKAVIRHMFEINESRKLWMLDHFHFEAKRSKRATFYKIWQDGNHAINLREYGIDIMDKVQYVHDNPVRAGLVREASDYVYSSAVDYESNLKGLLPVIIV